MLRAAIAFFVIALVAMVLGANNVAGVSMELGRTLLIVFVVLAIISFLISLAGGRKSGVLGLFLALGMGFAAFHLPTANADESAGAKINDTANDAKTTTKKVARNGKRQMRDATGHHSTVKDAKDSVNNGVDDATNAAKKAGNHTP